MALRAIGKRSNKLHAAALATAQKLAQSKNPAARWNGKDALREFNSPSVKRRLANKR
jgi:3-methyladenine DNA glycosylase AlkD